MLTKQEKQELKKLQVEYLKVKAEYDTIKKINDKNETKILQENNFLDEDGEKARKGYMIEDEASYEKFYTLVHEANLKDGIPYYEPEYVPSYRQYGRIKELEKRLFELQLKSIPAGLVEDTQKAQSHWKLRDRCLDLILRLDVRTA
jgi:hypothetical protein